MALPLGPPAAGDARQQPPRRSEGSLTGFHEALQMDENYRLAKRMPFRSFAEDTQARQETQAAIRELARKRYGAAQQ